MRTHGERWIMRRHWMASLALLIVTGAAIAQEKAVVPISSGGKGPAEVNAIIDEPAHPESGDHEHGASSRGWVRAEYLYWHIMHGPNTHSYVSTGPLSVPGNRLLYDPQQFDYDAFSGLRVTGNYALGCSGLSLE